MTEPRTAADRYKGHGKHDDWWCECGHPYAEAEAAAGSGSLGVRTQALRDAYWAHREVPGRHRGECCQDPCFPDITDRWVALVTARAALAAGSYKEALAAERRDTVERMTTALIRQFPAQGSYNRTAVWQAIYRVRDEEAAR